MNPDMLSVKLDLTSYDVKEGEQKIPVLYNGNRRYRRLGARHILCHNKFNCFRAVKKGGRGYMKKKLFAMLLLCLCLCFSFSNAILLSRRLIKMMHPPALSGENAGIQKAFEKAVNDKNIVMKTPTTGDYRSSFILYDFDGDSEDEAITLQLFYR